MRNRSKHVLGACSALLVAALALTVALEGCKSKKDGKDIKKIQNALKKLLKNPVDMHTARVDKVRAKMSKELSALLKKNDPARRAKLIKLIEGGDTLKARLLGDEIVAVNTSIDLWITDGKPAGVLVTNTGKQPMVAQLSLGCGAPPQRLPITVTMDDGKKKTKYVFKEANHIKVIFPAVPSKSKRLFIINTDKTWTPGTHDKRRLGVRFSAPLQPFFTDLLKKPDPARRAKLLKAIISGQVTDYMPLVEPYMGLMGVSPNAWTTGQGPAGLVIRNPGNKPYKPEFTLSCDAPKGSLPITATFDDGKKKTRFTFRKADARLESLPVVPAKSRVLYLITTDKTYSTPADDKSRFGVRITSPIDGGLRSLLVKPNPARRAKLLETVLKLKVDRLPMLGNVVVAVGLSGDRWTVGGGPAGIAVNNWSNRALPLELKVGCGAYKKEYLPITAIINDGKTTQKKVFNHPGESPVTLPPVPPRSKRLFIVTTDKTWNPGTHDKRWLGVNITANIGKVLHTLLQGGNRKIWDKMAGAIMQGDTMDRMPLLEDSIVALGLSPDRWTTNGIPAAVVINNKGAKSWKASLKLTVGAPKKSLPVTTTIDDGRTKITVVFKKAESRTIPLPAVASHTRKLFLITTDKTWSLSDKDHRVLGVNVSIPKSLKALPPSIPPSLLVPSKMGKGAPGAPGKGAPGAPGKGAPGAPGKAAPGVPGKGAPGAPGKGAPGVPGKGAPGVPGKGAPGKAAPTRGAVAKPAKAAPRKAPVKKR